MTLKYTNGQPYTPPQGVTVRTYESGSEDVLKYIEALMSEYPTIYNTRATRKLIAELRRAYLGEED